MVSIKHRYLEIQEQLRMAEKELERKFNQTNAYKNMKQMLDKKNEQIKDLRRRLNRYSYMILLNEFKIGYRFFKCF